MFDTERFKDKDGTVILGDGNKKAIFRNLLVMSSKMEAMTSRENQEFPAVLI